MEHPIRIGAVAYLNTKPLIHDFAKLAPQAELILDLPSRLADQLQAGTIDVGLIPVVEYFRGQDYQIIPNISIACHGPVLSVSLFSRKPWQEIQTLSLDEGSRTSAVLLQVLAKQKYGLNPKCSPLSMQTDAETVNTDAVLLIGDRAMRADLPGFPYIYDLGQEWWEWTGLPFVFAVWAVRSGVDLGTTGRALMEAKNRGLAQVASIAQQQAQLLQLDPAYCRRYLSHIIRFDLGPRELEGLRYFQKLALAQGLITQAQSIRLYPLETQESLLV